MDDDETRAFPGPSDDDTPSRAWSEYDGDGPTEMFPTAGSSAAGPTASAGSGSTGPGAQGTDGRGRPLVPPQDRSESDEDAGSGGPRAAIIAFLAIGVIVALGVLVLWMLSGRHHDGTPTAAPATTPSSSASPTTSTSASPTTTAPQSLTEADRCSEDYLQRQFGQTVTVRACDGTWVVLDSADRSGSGGLYRWSGERWVYVADPFSGACREQLAGEGVPDRFTADFPPCAPPTPSAAPSPPSAAPSSPSPSAASSSASPTSAGSSTPATGGSAAPSPSASPTSPVVGATPPADPLLPGLGR